MPLKEEDITNTLTSPQLCNKLLFTTHLKWRSSFFNLLFFLLSFRVFSFFLPRFFFVLSSLVFFTILSLTIFFLAFLIRLNILHLLKYTYTLKRILACETANILIYTYCMVYHQIQSYMQTILCITFRKKATFHIDDDEKQRLLG